MTTTIKLTPDVDGMEPVYITISEESPDEETWLVTTQQFTDILDLWADETTRIWDFVGATDDAQSIITSWWTGASVRLGSIQPADDDGELYDLVTLPFDYSASELTASQAASFSDDGEPFAVFREADGKEAAFYPPEVDTLAGDPLVSVVVHWSHLRPDVPVIMIGTAEGIGPIRVVLNDGDLWEGNPDTDSPQG